MMTAFATRRCPVCYKTGTIMVEENELFTYLRGEYVQNAFKSLTVPLREQIISGMHPDCCRKCGTPIVVPVYDWEPSGENFCQPCAMSYVGQING